jgi:hypothetical protein
MTGSKIDPTTGERIKEGAKSFREGGLVGFIIDSQTGERVPVEPPANHGDDSLVKSILRYAIPARVELSDHPEFQAAAPLASTFGAYATDIASAPRRLFGGAAKLLTGDTQGAKREMQKTKGDGILETINREGPLMLLTGGGSAAPQGARFAQKLMHGALEGVRASLPSAVVHQAQGTTEGQAPSATGLALELGTGGLLGAGGQLLRTAKDKTVSAIKTAISKTNEVGQDAVETATNPARLAEYQDIAWRTDGGKLGPTADDLALRVTEANASREGLAEGSRLAQARQFEEAVLQARNQVTGGTGQTIRDVSSAQGGARINQALTEARPAMQGAWVQGDRQALGQPVTYSGGRDAGPLRNAPIPHIMPDDGVAIPSVVAEIQGVLGNYKALTPDQGVPKITRAAIGAIRGVEELAHHARTIDDITNLKMHLRTAWDSGTFMGQIFDATTDDRAFAEVMEGIQVSEKSAIRLHIREPRRFKQVSDALDATNALYGRTKRLLSDVETRIARSQNSERIIPKIKSMGPDAAQLINEAQTNEVLRPVVAQMRAGFLDDLVLSSVKDGEISAAAGLKEWANISDDVKRVWLTPETIQRFDAAFNFGTMEIGKPEKAGRVLFGAGPKANPFLAAPKLENIGTMGQRSALAEVQQLDRMFGTDFEKVARDAYAVRQLRITPQGELPSASDIATGKSKLGVGLGSAVGGGVGSVLLGPGIGSAVGAGAGALAGLYAQSPAAAVLMYRALNRFMVNENTVRQALRTVAAQGARRLAYDTGKKDDGK